MNLSDRVAIIAISLMVASHFAEAAPRTPSPQALDIPAPIIVSPQGSLLGTLNFSKTLPGPSATLVVRDPVSGKVREFNCASLNRASTKLITGVGSGDAAPFTFPKQITDAKRRLGCKIFEI